MPNWTKEQEKAIYEPSGKKNILVSAAAGSGKTAVLVERIVNLITNSENPFKYLLCAISPFSSASRYDLLILFIILSFISVAAASVNVLPIYCLSEKGFRS